MNILEKILEEIEGRVNFREHLVKYEKRNGTITDVCRNEGILEELDIIKEIIRSHMDDGKDIDVHSNDDMEEKIRGHIAECLHRIDNIRSFMGSKEYTNNDEKCIRNMEVLKTSVTALEEYLNSKKKNGNNGWIPVTERLPEDDERYKGRKVIDVLVTTATGKVTKVQRQLTYKDIWVWGRIYGVPKAWQPLPEPYKGE